MVETHERRRSRNCCAEPILCSDAGQGSFVGSGEAGASGMNAQLKYADKRGSLCAVIQGSNERDHKDGPQVTIRDLVLGAELAASTKDRADYLELLANAQFTVAEGELVEAVRKVLARHGVAAES